ncbi:unnamed protein product [Orchesella dallaii]|uniref:Uncharacterized protein n=1 Tax=Orchesella dallaii TaxID=48710 RepID=A0ABP1RZC4_9HEXA
MKPLKRTECSKTDGMAFDVAYLRCRPVRKLRTCLQRECYPEESKLEDKDAWADETPLSSVNDEEETTTIRSLMSTIITGTTDDEDTNDKKNTTVTTHASFSSSASKSSKSGNIQSKKYYNYLVIYAIALTLSAIYSK